MGLMELIFGSGRNVLAETAQVFRASAENEAARAQALQEAALAQFAAEVARPRKGWFDRLIDGLNRLPRPAMALGTIGLFVAALIDPAWFGTRMAGVALVPEPLWWLLGAVVSFYFGARHQAKGQDFQRELAAGITALPDMLARLRALDGPGASEEDRGDGDGAQASTRRLPEGTRTTSAWTPATPKGSPAPTATSLAKPNDLADTHPQPGPSAQPPDTDTPTVEPNAALAAWRASRGQ